MRYLAFLILGFSLTVANANDSVRVVYSSFSDTPPHSDIKAETFISRSLVEGVPPRATSSTDRYFEEMRTILDRAKTPDTWGAPPIHTPFVTVTIVLGDRKHVLFASYADNGPELWLNPRAEDKKQFDALNEMLHLTAKQSALLMSGRK